MNKTIFISILLLCLGACSPKHNDYSRFADIDADGWVYGDTITINPSGLDSIKPRRLLLAIRHNNDFEYRNLWLEVTYGQGLSAYRDTINMILADIYGRWYGKGIGPSYQYETEITPAAYMSDSAAVHIRHIMRVDTLAGVEQVGITITDPDNNR